MRLIRLLRSNTFSFYEIRQFVRGSYPVTNMEDFATELFDLSPIFLWLALMVLGSGLLGIAMILLVKSRLRRRMLGQMKKTSFPTTMLDAWTESAKRMDGGS